jgi:hypothetical protein
MNQPFFLNLNLEEFQNPNSGYDTVGDCQVKDILSQYEVNHFSQGEMPSTCALPEVL